jgi:outer membrane protein assembly factor BamB
MLRVRWVRGGTLALVVTAGFVGSAAWSSPAEQSATPVTSTTAGIWPAWRGPLATGEAAGDPPVEWSETRNVRWKTAIPGAGASTPVIWGDTIYLQTAAPIGDEKPPRQTSFAFPEQMNVYKGLAYFRATREYEFSLVAVDRASGAIRWRKVLRVEQPAEGRHPTNTFASASPSTDGEHLMAFFGSRGLFALDMRGDVVWTRDFGEMQTRNGWGEGSSPTLFRDRVIVTWDHEGASFIAALDKRTGRELWRRDRDEPTTWATPLVVSAGGRVHVITNGRNHVRGYDVETGVDLWHGPGLTFNSIPSPVAAGGVAYLTSGFEGSVLLAVDLARARGDIEASGALLWRRNRDTPYVASPLLYDGAIYVFRSLQGILTSLDARTGAVRYGPVRIDALPDVYASPVAAAGRIYAAGRDGRVVVFRHGAAFETLAVNTLDDGFDASPAIAGDELYLRGRTSLYRISR